MKKAVFLSTLVGLLSLQSAASWAQSYFNQAAVFGTGTPMGSARFQGFGLAGIALPGDISNISNNPAGLGGYRRGDVSFSLGVNNSQTTTNYRNETNIGTRTGFNIPNGSLLLSNMKDPVEPGKFRGFTFGIAFNRIRDLNTVANFSGLARLNPVVTTDNNGQRNLSYDKISYIDDLLQNIQDNRLTNNQVSQDNPDFNAQLVYQGFTQYLIERDSANNSLLSFMPFADFRQNGSFRTTGRSYSYDASFGFNWDERLFFGFGGSVITHSYQTQTSITETFANVPVIQGFQPQGSLQSFSGKSYQLDRNDSYSGTGFLARAGLIYKPTDAVRLGLSYTSPTWTRMSQTTDVSLASSFQGATYINGQALTNNDAYTISSSDPYRYRLDQPGKIAGGMTVFVNNNGFFSLEAEYIDLSKARIRDMTSVFALSNEQTAITNNFQPTVNVRGGGEVKLGNVSLRAGLGFYQNPYKDSFLKDKANVYSASDNWTFNLGAGYRTNDYYLDFSIANRTGNFGFISHRYTPVATSQWQQTTITMTMGFPFD